MLLLKEERLTKEQIVLPSTTMNKASLSFPTLQQLWGYMQAINAHFVHINMAKRIMRCDCSEAELQLAVSDYGAKIIYLACLAPPSPLDH